MKIFGNVWIFVLLAGFCVVSCKSTEGASGNQANEKDSKALYQNFITEQTEINSEYSDGTSSQPRDLLKISPRLSKDAYFKKAMEHKDVANSAILEKNWAKAQAHLQLAFDSLKGFKVNRLITQAEDLIKVIRRRGLDKSYPKEYEKGVSALVNTRSSLDAGMLIESENHGKKSVDFLRKVQVGLLLVNDYTVVSGDCLWRISGKTDVYNDSFRWPKIYMANRNKFQNPDNPNLIYPGQVFDIPRY